MKDASLADAPSSSQALERLSVVARELGLHALEAEASDEARRLAERRFFVAFAGQFKRGKSTLLNALMGRAVLPVGVPPVTTVVTVLRHGEAAAARVHLRDGAVHDVGLDDVAEFVDERRNPGNTRGAVSVELFLPEPLLADGLCLVDTPGLGSVFATNTAATRSFLPRIDAAVIVLGSDPPITEDEARFAALAAEQSAHLVILLNKADRASHGEIAEAARFTQEVLGERLRRDAGPIFVVSARERTETGAPTRDWRAFEDRLATLARDSRAEMVGAAGRRAVTRLTAALRLEIGERESALRQPLEATEERVGRLRRAASEAERLLADLGALLSATEADLARRYDARRAEFMRHIAPAAERDLEHAIGSAPDGASLRERALEEARAVNDRHIRALLADMEPLGEELYAEATARFSSLASRFLSELLGHEDLPGHDPGFEKKPGFYFTHLMSHTRTGPFGWLADTMHIGLRRRVARDAVTYLRAMLFANGMRVVADLQDRVLESRRVLEARLRRRLTEGLASGERALAATRALHAEGSAAVAGELARLAALRAKLD